ncbi:MAG: VTT domain-containing protein [Anaerolineaceae bacterium]|nr:VTT domain-containing protein [Anaerolineaceae bacterium]
MKPEHRLNILRVFILVFVFGLTIYLLSIREQIVHLEEFGYPGVFLMNLLSSATVLIPVPGVLVTSAMGAVFHPFWVAVAAGLGAGLGEFSGFLAGFSGRAVLERTRWHTRVEGWMKRYGDITVLILAFIPNPLFDMAGITAGALKMNAVRFLVWCTIGKILKMLIFSYCGASILRWMNI